MFEDKFTYEFSNVSFEAYEELSQETIETLGNLIRKVTFVTIPDEAVSYGTCAEQDRGQCVYSIGDFFIKQYFVARFIDREQPYTIANEKKAIFEMLNQHNVDTPELVAIFTVKNADDQYEWNGIVTKKLDDWVIFDENDKNDHDKIIEVIEYLCDNNVCEHDLHFRNIMKRGNDWKLIDLDDCHVITDGVVKHKLNMASRVSVLCDNSDLKKKMEDYITSINENA